MDAVDLSDAYRKHSSLTSTSLTSGSLTPSMENLAFSPVAKASIQLAINDRLASCISPPTSLVETSRSPPTSPVKISSSNLTEMLGVIPLAGSTSRPVGGEQPGYQEQVVKGNNALAPQVRLPDGKGKLEEQKVAPEVQEEEEENVPLCKNVMNDIDEPLLKKIIKQNIEGITQKEAKNILNVIKIENFEKYLTKEEFIEKIKYVHEKKLHTIDPFCTYCFKRFHRRKHMMAHIAAVHEGKEKKFACDSCPSTFMSTTSLKYHKNTFHSVTREGVKCKVCGTVLSHQVSLLRHMKKHEEIHPTIQCDICQKSFGRKDNLTKHYKYVHNVMDSMNAGKMEENLKQNDNEFKCKMCQKEFSGASARNKLETHIMRHCQTFECAICKKCFGSKYTMKQHMKVRHGNQVKFNCSKCDYNTKYKSNLSKHMKQQHSE